MINFSYLLGIFNGVFSRKKVFLLNLKENTIAGVLFNKIAGLHAATLLK